MILECKLKAVNVEASADPKAETDAQKVRQFLFEFLCFKWWIQWNAENRTMPKTKQMLVRLHKICISVIRNRSFLLGFQTLE